MMSESRRNKRKNERVKHQPKSDILKKDKIIAVVVIILIFIAATLLAVYYSLYNSGVTLF